MESNCNKAHTNEPQQNTYTQSVTGIVIRDHKVLLARHTYGVGKNRLIVPGGYLEPGETPQEALNRRGTKAGHRHPLQPERLVRRLCRRIRLWHSLLRPR